MLISFTFENWRSFRDETTFTMLSTSEKRHANHLAHIKTFDRGRKRFELLPLALMYGGNASGKSNFAGAFAFMKWMVVGGAKLDKDKRIPLQPYLLGNAETKLPSRFKVQFFLGETAYSYEFSASTERIENERLSILSKSDAETLLFARDDEKKLEFGKAFEKENEKNLPYLKSLGRAMHHNCLYLSYVNAQNEKNEQLERIFTWFKKGIMVITPQEGLITKHFLLDVDNPILRAFNDAYPLFDTGIYKLAGKLVPIEQHRYGEFLIERLKDIPAGETEIEVGTDFFKFIEGQWHYVKPVSCHKASDGREVDFDFSQESDGTKRLYDLLPLFLRAFDLPETVVIDEIDRSLHPLLTRRLLDVYLSNRTQESRAQLILTTHDAMLLDQDILRRDEIWVAERDESGVSKIFSFSDFKDVRADKDIRKSYLQGRMGGVPKLRMSGVLCNQRTEQDHD